MEYLIRPCREDDLSDLINLIDHHATYEKAVFIADGKEVQLKAALFSQSPRLNALVVEVDGMIVGYATYTIDYSTWYAQDYLHMDCMYVEPEFRGLKIGAALIDRLTQIAAEQECCNIQWQTPDWNERAIRFYHRVGSRSLKKIRFYKDA